jgi:hypothetical protein
MLLGLVPLGEGQSLQPATNQPPQAKSARQLRERLSQPITLDKGVESNTSLNDALEFIADRFDVPIVLNRAAFADQAIRDHPIGVQRMVGIKLSTVLRMIASQVDAVYLVHNDHVEITHYQRASPLCWQTAREWAPTVDAEFASKPLSEVLQNLSDETGISIVVDGRCNDQSQTAVTATLNSVPLDTAVEMLADMAGLMALRGDRLIYVTSVENAVQAKQSRKAVE